MQIDYSNDILSQNEKIHDFLKPIEENKFMEKIQKKDLPLLTLLLDKNPTNNPLTVTRSNSFFSEADYDLQMVKKIDEGNNSLSDISDFDLEEEQNELNNSFNSSEDKDCNEIEEIVEKRRAKNENLSIVEDTELDKELDNIVLELLKKNE